MSKDTERKAQEALAAARGSAADVAMEQLKSARDWILKMAREAEKQERILDALNLESIAELIESAEPKLRQNAKLSA